MSSSYIDITGYCEEYEEDLEISVEKEDVLEQFSDQDIEDEYEERQLDKLSSVDFYKMTKESIVRSLQDMQDYQVKEVLCDLVGIGYQEKNEVLAQKLHEFISEKILK